MSVKSTALSVVGSVALGTLGAIGGWLAYSRWFVDHNVPLPPALDAGRGEYLNRRHNRLMNYYSDTSASGRPLVLVHSINAGASAYEMRPIFQYFRDSRPVYALDLPGFGLSDRSNREYSVRLYTDCIADFLKDTLSEPADVVALSLSSEFVARAALEHPQQFHSLTLISPSGFTSRDRKRSSQSVNQSGGSGKAYRILANPIWSEAFYDLLVTRPSIRYFLRQSFAGPVDQGLADYDYATTHRPGARFAPLYFVSGKLFSADIFEAVYQKLDLPVLVIYDRDGFVRFDRLPELADRRSNWHLARIAPTLGLPHFEKMSEVAASLNRFWHEVSRNATHVHPAP